MSGVGSVTQATTLQTPTTVGTDKALQDIQDKVGNRSVGGKISSWIRNNTVLKGHDSSTTHAFREALKHKVGSSDVADSILNQVGVDVSKALSSRQASEAITLAKAYVKDNDAALNDKSSKLAQSVKNAMQQPETSAEKTARDAANLGRTKDNNEKIRKFGVKVQLELADDPNYVPKDYEKPFLSSQLSHSGEILQKALGERLQGADGNVDKSSANRVAKSIMQQLRLKDDEAITDAHIAKANVLAGRYERFAVSDLAMAGLPEVAATDFITTWENVSKVGTYDDPRFNKLQDEEIVCIFKYTTADYKELNSIIRNNTLPNADASKQAIIAAVNSGLANLDTFNGISFRGSDMPQSFEAVFQKGQIFTDSTYLSSAANDKSSFEGHHQMGIAGHSGRDVSFLSFVPSETEVLFPPGTKFHVKDRQGDITYLPTGDPDPADKNYVRIYLQEVYP